MHSRWQGTAPACRRAGLASNLAHNQGFWPSRGEQHGRRNCATPTSLMRLSSSTSGFSKSSTVVFEAFSLTGPNLQAAEEGAVGAVQQRQPPVAAYRAGALAEGPTVPRRCCIFSIVAPEHILATSGVPQTCRSNAPRC